MSIITNSQRKFSISLSSTQELVGFLLSHSKNSEKVLTLDFVSKKKIALLHQFYFQDPTPTDCISIAYEDQKFLGEIFVCPQVAYEYVQKELSSLEKELTLYVVHGFLHLLGFDDRDKVDEKKMRVEEKKWMAALDKNHLQITIGGNG